MPGEAFLWREVQSKIVTYIQVVMLRMQLDIWISYGECLKEHIQQNYGNLRHKNVGDYSECA